MEILLAIIGLIVGFVVAWFFLSSKLKDLSNDNSKLLERSSLLEKDKESQAIELRGEREKVVELNNSLSSLKSDYANLQQKLTEQKGEIEQLQEKFTKEFENLANKIFEEKGKAFTETNKTNLSQILDPLKEKIKDFEKKVEESNKENIDRHASLRQQLQMLKDMNQEITKEAKNLTEALKGQTKTQGNWGEFILESILEKSGLVKGREYVVQESLTAESGKRYQPDVIIKLPENKSIIIDSKVSLIGYEKFISSENEKDQQLALRDHNISIRSHIKNLASKNYQNLYQLESLDFVLMFMPIEPAFALAVQQDPEIFNDAFEQNIVIVSPSTLLATLRTIASIWRQENQNKNALEIARQAGSLYDKFVNFYNDLVDVGKKMDSAKDSYENAMKKIHEGRGNLISSVEKIKELGAKASKTLPPAATNRAEE
ncbi:MAG: DNA recombination protein RmuC [Ignavibacteriaceae bacterium]|nr:DNA recombination protein RmuC [Ignavibacteriaceae bacterium]